MKKYEYDNPHPIMDEVIFILQKLGYELNYVNGGSQDIGLLGIPEYPVIEVNGVFKKKHIKDPPEKWFVWNTKNKIMVEPVEWDEKVYANALNNLKEWAKELKTLKGELKCLNL